MSDTEFRNPTCTSRLAPIAPPTATLRVAAGCASVSGCALYKEKWSHPSASKLSSMGCSSV
ncbi:hypothetical protein, partial [Acidaminobacter sp.]|uniref:hypothetical protein n=1 Tax=Acidaminobacter sp. TaxID=1872102 RepID=UPI00256C6645